MRPPRPVRALLSLLVLAALVVGLAAGLVALATRWSGSAPTVARPTCTAEVAAPSGEGVLRAELAPDQTANAALVVGLADRRGLPARAATIGIATAIQESSLRNIDYGDRDSLGLFQQRPSQGWGSEEQVQDPLYATNTFYDALVRVDGYAGMEVTVAAQRVQRSGFPEAYADHEDDGRALASSLYGLSPASLTCDLPPVEDGGDPAASAQAVVSELQAWATGGWQASTGPAEPADDATADEAATTAPVLTLDATAAADPARTAWALAHSAVALAQRHDVVRVDVDGQVWDRSEPGAGWVAAEDAPTATEAGDGRVRLSFA